MLVVTRYRGGDPSASMLSDLTDALEVLAARPGFVRGAVGRATDDPGLWVLSTQWRGVGDYRRALSAYDVKLRAVPVLARALDEPTAFEVLTEIDSDVAGEQPRRTSAPSGLAADAREVPLGEASAPRVLSDLDPD